MDNTFSSMDGIGHTAGHNTIARFNAAAELAERLEALVRGYPTLQWAEPWPQSNHSTFAFRGVPALAFSSAGAFALAHFPADTVEQVSIAKLAGVVAAAREIAMSLAASRVSAALSRASSSSAPYLLNKWGPAGVADPLEAEPLHRTSTRS